MLSDVIGGLLVAALAVAISPLPIVAVVLILGTPRARTAGPAFALGWVAGLVCVSLVVLLLVGTGSGREHASVGWLKIAIGALLVAMAARRWRKRPRHDQRAESPRWMAGLDRATPGRVALIGAALSGANPKNLALTLTAAASIADAGLGVGKEAIATAVFVLVGSTTIAGPVLFYLLDAERAERPLASIRRFMADNDAVIVMLILLLLGAKLIGDGLGSV
jgi:threonine/homoserine/homoserine lactone efflux protein